jgi:tryptophan halogenase
MNITVVGGGTAGCLSALFCQRFFPAANITLIDNSGIGVIGVGESTTPSLIEMLDFLGISTEDMVKQCGATIKNSTKFTNWNGDGQSYHHGFDAHNDLDMFYGSNKSYYTNNKISWAPHKPFLALNELYHGRNLENIHLSSQLSLKNKVPFTEDSLKTSFNYSDYGLHFDAKKVAEYFKKLSIERGVLCIDGLIEESRLTEQGFVQSLKLKDGREILCDFVLDCSGFYRLFVEKTYKSKFNSFKDFLPVKKAIPFFLKRTEENPTPTFTEAIALKYGWMWKTPVEGRFGCGYVFDSDYISEDEAYKEVSELIGEDPVVNRCISFESGYFENPWNKNVLAVGLASGFLEPLEATSIWITVISLHLLIENISGMIHKDEKSINEYNKQFTKSINSILALVQFHYYTKRKDSNFWKEFRQKNQTPELLKEILEIYSYRLPSSVDNYRHYSFPTYSWYLVASGINYFTKESIIEEYISYNIGNALSKKSIEEFMKKINTVSDACIDHDTFLKRIREEK